MKTSGLGREGIRLGLALIWLIGVIVVVRSAQAAFGVWNRRQEGLLESQERLARLVGWLEVKEEVLAKEQEILAASSSADPASLGLVGLAEIQRLASSLGLSITDLRPSEVPAQKGKNPFVRLDLKVEGPLDQVGPFLQQLPERLPGVGLETLQLTSQPDGQAQALLRLNLPYPKGANRP